MKPRKLRVPLWLACLACLACIAAAALCAPGLAAAQATATPAPATEELPPAPPPVTAAPAAAPAPAPATEPAPQRTGCPLGQRMEPGGRCVDSDADPWTEGDAPVPPSLTGYHTHDGFMLRMTGGLGGAGSSMDVPILGTVDLTGAAWFSSLDIGGSITDNLVLHGRASSVTVFDPKVTVDGDELGNADGNLAIQLFAPALTYYFMPINLYVTGAVGVAVVDVRQDDGSNSGDEVGWGVNLDVGKEWWVGHNWGVGVAGRFVLGSVTLDNTDVDAGFAGVGVLFSATYQ